MNQAQMILEHLEAKGSITVPEAEAPPILCKRLASRIDDIHNGRGARQAFTRRELIMIPSGKWVAKYHSIHESDTNVPLIIPEKVDRICQVSDPCQSQIINGGKCMSYYRRGKNCNRKEFHE